MMQALVIVLVVLLVLTLAMHASERLSRVAWEVLVTLALALLLLGVAIR